MRRMLWCLGLMIGGIGSWNVTTWAAPSAMGGNEDVVAAINSLRIAVTKSIENQGNSSNQQLAELFNKTINGVFDKTGLKGLSLLDTKIRFYAEKFYQLFTTKTFSSTNLAETLHKNQEQVGKLLSRELGYSMQKNTRDKIGDASALLSQEVEAGANNIEAKYLGSVLSGGDFSPFGSMNDKFNPAKEKIPNFNDLVGPDGYTEAQKNQARLFISYLLQAAPAPEVFYIPDQSTATKNTLTMYFPNGGEGNEAPYSKIEISTEPKYDKTAGAISSEYGRMVEYLKKETKYYQKYKSKIRTTNVLRSLYIGNILQTYQDRLKLAEGAESNRSSMIELEKSAAINGLDRQYYEELKTRTVADINLEMLRTLNKLAYFVYRLHQDNERNTLLLAVTGLQLLGQDAKDNTQYIKPLRTLIENRCWDLQGDSSDDRKQACENPISSSGSSS